MTIAETGPCGRCWHDLRAQADETLGVGDDWNGRRVSTRLGYLVLMTR